MKRREGYTDDGLGTVTPAVVLDLLLDLGHQPSRWRPFARARWSRDRRAIISLIPGWAQ